MPEIKKPIKLGALAMVFLCVSVIFTILAYGYGAARQTIAVVDWCHDNIEAIAQNEGYTIIRDVVEPKSSFIPEFSKNIEYMQTTCENNISLCED